MRPNEPKKSLRREFQAKPKPAVLATQRSEPNVCNRRSKHDRRRQQYSSNYDTAVHEALQLLPPARAVAALERLLRTMGDRESYEVAVPHVRTDNGSTANCRGVDSTCATVVTHRAPSCRGKVERSFGWVKEVVLAQWRHRGMRKP